MMSDAGGLFLLVSPNGPTWWRLKYRFMAKYRFMGKEKLLSLVVYPVVSLKAARERRDEARWLMAAAIDPSAKGQAEREAHSDTLEAIAREWFANFSPAWTESHLVKTTRRLERDIFPGLDGHPIAIITPADLLTCTEPTGIEVLLQALEGYTGGFAVNCAMRSGRNSI